MNRTQKADEAQRLATRYPVNVWEAWDYLDITDSLPAATAACEAHTCGYHHAAIKPALIYGAAQTVEDIAAWVRRHPDYRQTG